MQAANAQEHSLFRRLFSDPVRLDKPSRLPWPAAWRRDGFVGLPWVEVPSLNHYIERVLVLRCDNNSTRIVIMIRTQISLSEREYRAAKAEAARLGISLAELLRQSLRHIIPADGSRPWMRYAGMIETGEEDASQKIDEVVYGQKK